MISKNTYYEKKQSKIKRMCTKQLLLNNSKAERKKYYANRYTNISEEEKT